MGTDREFSYEDLWYRRNQIEPDNAGWELSAQELQAEKERLKDTLPLTIEAVKRLPKHIVMSRATGLTIARMFGRWKEAELLYSGVVDPVANDFNPEKRGYILGDLKSGLEHLLKMKGLTQIATGWYEDNLGTKSYILRAKLGSKSTKHQITALHRQLNGFVTESIKVAQGENFTIIGACRTPFQVFW